MDIPEIWAAGIGGFLIIISSYSIYSLLFRSEKIELSQKGFKELRNFNMKISEMPCSFQVVWDSFYINRSAVPCFWYALTVTLKNPTPYSIKITRRNKMRIFLWKIGIGKKGDTLTGNTYFDSRFWVKMQDQQHILSLIEDGTINRITHFDQNYPPIRKKFGRISISESCIKYLEGPYDEQQRIFDPHRGNVENTLTELVIIAQRMNTAKN
ncbi:MULTISPECIES: hypothetical protein [unclassified Lentimonas]|uniref:hypothetical protein n=1 Tax=unclassified Lentimonas TaxID=2630993 RepID=UPI00138A0144|nr:MULTISPECIES: hypothetical protein [unclassified Lentimonas]